MNLKEAAEVLESTSEAIRKRAKRGTIPSEVGEDGMLYVWVDDRVDAAVDEGSHRVDDRVDGANDEGSYRVDDNPSDAYRDLVLDRMGSEIDWLRREVERKDTIFMQMAQRIPELEAPPVERDAPSPGVEGNGGEVLHDQERPQEQRSWWRHFFGIE